MLWHHLQSHQQSPTFLVEPKFFYWKSDFCIFQYSPTKFPYANKLLGATKAMYYQKIRNIPCLNIYLDEVKWRRFRTEELMWVLAVKTKAEIEILACLFGGFWVKWIHFTNSLYMKHFYFLTSSINRIKFAYNHFFSSTNNHINNFLLNFTFVTSHQQFNEQFSSIF